MDDSILAGPNESESNQIVEDMKASRLKLTAEGDITSNFLGEKIQMQPDRTIRMTQPQLIDSVLKDLCLDGSNVATKSTLATLNWHPDSQPFDGHFDYRSIIGKANYHEKSTRPKLEYAVHQCARSSSNPKVGHGKAVKWLDRYLRATRDKGLIFKPTDQSFDCWVDANFSGNWDPKDSNARSRTRYVITCASCPIIRKSKMQTQAALSTTESEYTSLSTALREAIYLQQMIQEMRDHNLNFKDTHPKVLYRAFKDNSGALEMANIHKLRPRTKHLAVTWHHFHHYVEDGSITILPISTDHQIADCLTKSNNLETLKRHRQAIMGW